MPKGFDWDAAAKRDYIREHGSVPYWFDVPKPKSLERRPEETKTGKALAGKARARGAKVVAEFATLSAEAKVVSANQYRDRIRRACLDERRSVPPSKKRYAGAIATVEKELLGQIKGHVKRARVAAKAVPPMARNASPATLLGIPVGQKPPNGKHGGKPSQPRGGAKSAAPAERPTTNAPKRRSKLSDLPAINVSARVVGGRLELTWDADERADRWMLTLLRRRNGSARAVERVALPATTTHITIAAKMSDGPYSVRLFGIGRDGPVTRGAVDGIGSRPSTAKRKAKSPSKTLQAPRSGKARARKASSTRGSRKKASSKAGIKSAMRNVAAAGRPRRVSFWRGR